MSPVSDSEEKKLVPLIVRGLENKSYEELHRLRELGLFSLESL